MVFPWYEMSFWEMWRSRTGVFFREESEQLVEQLFLGLRILHRVPLMHGDLSWANLLMRAGPCSSQLACKFSLVIGDFGSASYLPATSRPACTEYVRAPELVLRVPARSLSAAVDVWAAGIFVASLLKGQMFPQCPECVEVLGPLTEADWPGCADMPAFQELKGRLTARTDGSQPEGTADSPSIRRWYFGESPNVTRCDLLDADVDMMERMLAWAPSRRKTVQDLMGHSFFRGSRAEHELRNVVRRISRDDLEDVVMMCGLGGVTLRHLLAMLPRPIQPVASVAQPCQQVAAHSQRDAPEEPRQDGPASSARSQGEALPGEDAPGLAAPQEEAQEQPRKHLGACAGNCGRLACQRKQNQGARPICQLCESTDHPSGRCELCRCETYECKGNCGLHGARLKTGGDSRWCCACARGVQNLGNSKYANAFGIHSYPRRWGQALRLTARFAFVCVRMVPMDVAAMAHFFQFVRAARWPWKGFHMAVIIVASAMKWPFAISAFEAALSGIRDSSTAEVALASCIMTVVEACDGVAMETMHNEVSKTGRAACTTGLIWMLRKLGFIESGIDEGGSQPEADDARPGRTLRKRKSDPSPKPAPGRSLRKRKSAPSPKPQGPPADKLSKNEFRLGKLQTVYRVECDDVAMERCGRLINVAAGVPVLPAAPTARDLRVFCPAVVAATQAAFEVSAKDTNGYTYKTIARKVMVLHAEPDTDIRLAASGADGPWDPLHMSEILEWMPDEDELLKPLMILTCAQARRLFAMSPPWISCFACYMGTLSSKHIDALMGARSIDLLRTVERFGMEHDFAPSIETVAATLMASDAAHGQ